VGRALRATTGLTIITFDSSRNPAMRSNARHAGTHHDGDAGRYLRTVTSAHFGAQICQMLRKEGAASHSHAPFPLPGFSGWEQRRSAVISPTGKCLQDFGCNTMMMRWFSAPPPQVIDAAV
jgi:hypothetical protein